MLINESRVPIKEILLTGWMPSTLKIAYYRAKGAQIGKGVKIGLGSVLITNQLEIGNDTKIGFATILRGREIKIGSHTYIGSTTYLDVEKIFIGDDAKINEQVFAGGPMFPDSYLHIGSRTTVMQHTFLNPSKPLIIRDGAGVGGRCSIFTHSSWQNMFEGYPVKFAPIEIGEDAWIPWDVFIMPGVTIGAGATVGAGSLVIKDVPAGALAAGLPAKVLRNPGEYITPPSHAEKVRMLMDIMSQFSELILYHGYNLEFLPTEKEFEFIYQGKKQNGQPIGKILIYVSEQGSLEPHNLPIGCTLVTVSSIDHALQKGLIDRRILWVDVENATRIGPTNDLGEQLIDFLKRFGLHLNRL